MNKATPAFRPLWKRRYVTVTPTLNDKPPLLMPQMPREMLQKNVAMYQVLYRPRRCPHRSAGSKKCGYDKINK